MEENSIAQEVTAYQSSDGSLWLERNDALRDSAHAEVGVTLDEFLAKHSGKSIDQLREPLFDFVVENGDLFNRHQEFFVLVEAEKKAAEEAAKVAQPEGENIPATEEGEE